MDDVALLRKLVEIPSVSGNEREASEFLVEQMREMGFESYVDEVGNAVGIIGSGDTDILFVGHIDTVPGEIDVRIEGDELWGRGVVDAKGSLVAAVCAASRLNHAPLRLPQSLRSGDDFSLKKGAIPGARIVVIGAVEEEIYTSRGARGLIGKYNASVIIIGEPSGVNKITLGYKGSLRARYRVSVPCFHTAGEGMNANEMAIVFWNSCRAYAEKVSFEEKVFDQLQVSLISMSSGGDGLTEWAEVELRWRIPLKITKPDTKGHENVFNEVKVFVRSVAGPPQGSGRSAELEFYGEEVPHVTNKNNVLVRAFLSSMREQGLEPRFVKKTGTSDMNVLSPHYDCPIVAYGPGDSSLDHTPEERLSVSEFRKSIDVLEGVFKGL